MAAAFEKRFQQKLETYNTAIVGGVSEMPVIAAPA